MVKKLVSLSTVALLTSSLFANVDMETRLTSMEKEIKKLENQLKKSNKKLNKVKAHGAGDNIKFGIDFRNTLESLHYKNNDTGVTAKNTSLLTSRLYLNMAAAPSKKLMFKGKLAVYNTWGTHLYVEDAPLKDWSGSSKPADSLMRIKEAYFVYKGKIGNQPLVFSVGRRPASTGFLANYRENEVKSGSPLAHITNMEVNGAMVKIPLGKYSQGAYTKIVLGRAHTGEMEGVYGTNGINPFAQLDTTAEDENVDFLVIPGVAYNDGQYNVMYQYAHIFNTKGKNLDTATKKVAAGSVDLYSVGLKVDGIGEEISDFWDDTTMFASVGMSQYNPKDGYALLTTEDGKSVSGESIWMGMVIPDTITESGKIGFEYNKGSKYWTPMTWAEDTNIGSKIAVRGSAYEVYWNTNFFGSKNLTSQIRYTHIQHDYTPNINCAGWVPVENADITATSLRFGITYKY